MAAASNTGEAYVTIHRLRPLSCGQHEDFYRIPEDKPIWLVHNMGITRFCLQAGRPQGHDALSRLKQPKAKATTAQATQRET